MEVDESMVVVYIGGCGVGVIEAGVMIVFLLCSCAYVLHDYIVGGYPISRHEEEGGRVDFIQISNLARGQESQSSFEVGMSVGHG